MKRNRLLLSGAAGIVLAALFYVLAIPIQGALKFLVLIPDAGVVIFVLLLFISLMEIVVMVFVLTRLAQQLPLRVMSLLAAGYVGFAGVYALGYAFFAADARGIQILAACCVVRWFTLFLVRV